jgi:hypothetical protein
MTSNIILPNFDLTNPLDFLLNFMLQDEEVPPLTFSNEPVVDQISYGIVRLSSGDKNQLVQFYALNSVIFDIDYRRIWDNFSTMFPEKVSEVTEMINSDGYVNIADFFIKSLLNRYYINKKYLYFVIPIDCSRDVYDQIIELP